MDPRMPKMSLPKWEEICENFYAKYSGLATWQNDNYREVCAQGELQSFTGRIYKFKKVRKKDGSWIYPRPAVCNYPVQGCATGDLVPLAMVIVNKRLIKEGLSSDVKIIMQVHDSIVLDAPTKYVDKVCNICYEVFNSMPIYIQDYWGYEWSVPLTGECAYGPTWGKMVKWKP